MKRQGFTLLEVMVAIAILALSLTAIFSSQLGAMRIGNRARRTHMGALLGRCKMAELEEQVLREGLPAIDARGTDACCEGAEVEGYRCSWVMERVVLPSTAAEGEEGSGGRAGAQGQGGAGADPAIGSMATPGDFLATLGDDDAFASMAINTAYPAIKPAIEELVRRATVTVHWNEGERDVSFDVVYYIVNPTSAVPGQPNPGVPVGGMPPPAGGSR